MILLLTLCAAPLLVFAQGQVDQPARKILELTDAEQIQFVKAALDQGLPEGSADQMAMLVINRSSITLPLIEERIEEALQRPSVSRRFVDTAAELIAYAGDEEALNSIIRLIRIDETKFTRLVGRALTHSANWRNPFTLGYWGLEMGDETVARCTTTWVESVLSSNRMQRAWAEAMLDQYGKVPDDSDWANDPIASKLKGGGTAELQRNVISLAREALRKRQQQQ